MYFFAIFFTYFFDCQQRPFFSLELKFKTAKAKASLTMTRRVRRTQRDPHFPEPAHDGGTLPRRRRHVSDHDSANARYASVGGAHGHRPRQPKSHSRLVKLFQPSARRADGRKRCFGRCEVNPKPYTLNPSKPKPYTLHPTSQTIT